MKLIHLVEKLLAYGVYHQLLFHEDVVMARNTLWQALGIAPNSDYVEVAPQDDDIYALLDALFKAVDPNRERYPYLYQEEQFYAELMAHLMPRNSELNRWFWGLQKHAPEAATQAFYAISKASTYIRMDRIAKNISYQADTSYGKMDITINLTKPEKDPAEIALLKTMPTTGYPKCLLCVENSGFSGNVGHPARHQHRLIKMQLGGEPWYFQFSPYVYYHEHAIVLSETHRDMVIDAKTFERLLSFVGMFPHYFIGSNADLPIVGGSILNHDHYQAGAYEMPMMRAQVLGGFSEGVPEGVQLDILDWPLSVVRLRSDSEAKLVDVGRRIHEAWIDYSDAEMSIYAHTTERHNTTTPIARRVGEAFELCLALRNNRTSEAHPDGIFHPHRQHHHIKKENIGLIEVMGLAVLPARLKTELEGLVNVIVGSNKVDLAQIASDEALEKHVEWVENLKPSLEACLADTQADEALMALLKQAVGVKFQSVLEDAGVFKKDLEAWHRFLKIVF